MNNCASPSGEKHTDNLTRNVENSELKVGLNAKYIDDEDYEADFNIDEKTIDKADTDRTVNSNYESKNSSFLNFSSNKTNHNNNNNNLRKEPEASTQNNKTPKLLRRVIFADEL